MQPRADIMAFVLAGGRGSRLHPLTAHRAKPAVPFAGGCRLIDFALASLFNSGIRDICVLAQYQAASLTEHLDATWHPWARAVGATLSVALPNAAEGYAGTADAVRQHLDRAAARDPALVAVFAADHVYRMNVRQMAAFHRDSGADLTVAALPVPIDKARAFGVIEAAPDGRVRAFEEKPGCPAPMPGDSGRAFASMGNYLFDRATLERVLADTGEHAVDFGHHVLPRAVAAHRVFAYNFGANRIAGLGSHEDPAYWRDVGTFDALLEARCDAAGARPRIDLRNPRWPIAPHVVGMPSVSMACGREDLRPGASRERQVPDLHEARDAGSRVLLTHVGGEA